MDKVQSAPSSEAEGPKSPSHRLWASAGRARVTGLWARLRRDPLAVASLIFITGVIILAAIGPPIYEQLAPPGLTEYHTYYFQDYAHINSWPSALHWLGTDALGRDTLARLMAGLRVSLLV